MDTVHKTTGLTTENKTSHGTAALGIKYNLDALSDDFEMTLMHNRIGSGSEYITNFLRLKKVISNYIVGSNYYAFEKTVSDAKVVCLIAET